MTWKNGISAIMGSVPLMVVSATLTVVLLTLDHLTNTTLYEYGLTYSIHWYGYYVSIIRIGLSFSASGVMVSFISALWLWMNSTALKTSSKRSTKRKKPRKAPISKKELEELKELVKKL